MFVRALCPPEFAYVLEDGPEGVDPAPDVTSLLCLQQNDIVPRTGGRRVSTPPCPLASCRGETDPET